MGEFRFRLPSDWELASRQASSIHVIGLDGIPWPCRVFTEGTSLVVGRNREESGKLYISYPSAKYGELTICTGTLPERRAPYGLVTELARGTMNRLRNQISIWQEGGLEITPEVHELADAATGKLGSAIMGADSEFSDKMARESLSLSLDAVFELSRVFGEKISKFRNSQVEEFPKFWFANQCSDDGLEESLGDPRFELAQVGVGSLEHELISGAKPRKRLIIGPFLDASAGGMCDEVVLLDDFEARKNLLLSQGRNAIENIPPVASLLHVVSGLNGLGHRHLSYPQQLQVTIDMLRMIEEAAIEVPSMVSFDFPWGERLASSVGGVHPLQIADNLLRQGLQMSFLGLDINLDYWPAGSVVRDPLQWIDLVDVWSQLGLPLILCVRLPSGDKTSSIDIASEGPKGRLVNEVRSNLSDDQRFELLQTVVPMMIARPSVHGIIYRQWSDSTDFRFPGGGLVDSGGAEKPLPALIGDLRSQFLDA